MPPITKPLVAIVGPSGSGKSTSLRNLNPDEVVILDGELKGFPFKGAERFTILPFSNPAEYDARFKEALALGRKYIIVESFTKLAYRIKNLCATSWKGFDIYSNYSRMVRNTINSAKNTVSTVIFTSIDDIVELPQADGSQLVKRMIGVEGKELLKQGGIEPDMLVILFTDVRKQGTTILHQFETNNDGITTAKSPMDMFPDRFIPNDLATALGTLEAFYK